MLELYLYGRFFRRDIFSRRYIIRVSKYVASISLAHTGSLFHRAACTDCLILSLGDITLMYKIAYSQTSACLDRRSTEKHAPARLSLSSSNFVCHTEVCVMPFPDSHKRPLLFWSAISYSESSISHRFVERSLLLVAPPNSEFLSSNVVMTEPISSSSTTLWHRLRLRVLGKP